MQQNHFSCQFHDLFCLSFHHDHVLFLGEEPL
jgi:hypothetical protein